MSAELVESMELQLRSLYEEREFLESRFGVSSAEGLVGMVDSLESQLRDFYDRFGGYDAMGDAESAILLDRLRSLSGQLDSMYSQRTVEFFMEDEKPVLRAKWIENLAAGDNQ